MPLKVFISYAREDEAKALKYYELLLKEGTSPWIDVRQLLPGQNWPAEIERAFSDANVVILLLSTRSISKRGFVQREANDAVEKLRYKQPTDIYVIPLLLEPCEVPTHIASRLQYVDMEKAGAWDQVCSSLKLAAEQQSIEITKGASIGPFQMFTEKMEEKWAGSPGHDISIEFPRFEWPTKSDIAKQLTQLFAGRAFRTLIESRQKPWNQMPDAFPNPGEFLATNGRWDGFGVVHATDRLLSLTYEVGWYGAGAAHPNSFFETYNFSYDERLYILDLGDFFTSNTIPVERISKLCIDQLCREYWSRTGEKPGNAQLDWFKSGAGETQDNFSAFTISQDRFTFLFAPYEVGPYALGRWSIDISFYDLLEFLRPDGPHLLATS